MLGWTLHEYADEFKERQAFLLFSFLLHNTVPLVIQVGWLFWLFSPHALYSWLIHKFIESLLLLQIVPSCGTVCLWLIYREVNDADLVNLYTVTWHSSWNSSNLSVLWAVGTSWKFLWVVRIWCEHCLFMFYSYLLCLLPELDPGLFNVPALEAGMSLWSSY